MRAALTVKVKTLGTLSPNPYHLLKKVDENFHSAFQLCLAKASESRLPTRSGQNGPHWGSSPRAVRLAAALA